MVGSGRRRRQGRRRRAVPAGGSGWTHRPPMAYPRPRSLRAPSGAAV